MLTWFLKFTFRGISFCFILLTIYLVFPSDHVAIEHHYSTIPNRTGVIEVNERLTEAQILTTEIHGAEDFTLKDGILYTGDIDGIIWQVNPENGQKTKYLRTNGRPLSLKFDKNENLIVADAYLGLLSVDKERKVTQLCSETADGVPIRFADFLDIAEDGTIYFTDASSFPLHHLLEDVFSGVPTGRVLKYDPKEGKCHTIFDKIHFANGIILTDNGNALLVCETFSGTVLKFYLNGPKKGKREVFLETPGLPDNIYHGSNGLIYIPFPADRNAAVENIQKYPFLKTVLMKLFRLLGALPAKKYAHVIAVEEKTGKIVKSWEDPNGVKISTVTSAFEHNGYLYLGTYKEKYIAKLKL